MSTLYQSAVGYLEQLVAINSTRGREAAVADLLEPVLRQLGFEVESYPRGAARRNLLASRGDNPAICGYGHMDTVPAYAGWETDPFRLTQRGNKLYGLGVHDMKAGIATLLAAVEQLPRTLPLKLLFCFDEEYDSDGAWLVARERADWFEGVTHMLSVEAGTAVGVIRGRPSMTLGRRGRARYQVEIRGFSSHGGTTERGVSAITLAGRLITAIESTPMASHALLGTGSQFVASISSETPGLSVPDRCVLEIERHFVPPETVESVLAGYRRACEQVLAGLELTPEQRLLVSIRIEPKPRANPYMAPYVTPADDPLVQAARSVMNQMLGQHLVTYGRSVADENIFATVLGKPVIVVGPTGGNEHSPNEWVDGRSLGRYGEFYQRLLETWTG